MTVGTAALGLLGLATIAVANYDALVATLALGSGSRPMTQRLATLLRHVLRRIPRLLPAGGPIVLLSTVATWIGMLWVGYSMVFLADASAVLTSDTGEPASTVSRIYYAGYTLFTLGNGGFQPADGVWQLITVLAALNGLFVVTLSITFLVPVVSAVVQGRQLASMVSALGATAEEVVVSTWDGSSFAHLEAQLPNLSEQILLSAQRHLAYPVLHDFRSRNPESASMRSLAVLDEAITLLEHGVAEEVPLSPPSLRTARFAIDQARRLVPIQDEASDAPPLPDLGYVQRCGIPVRSVAEYTAAVERLDDRRRHLASILAAAAWSWPTMTGQTGDHVAH